ncbi:hypothetical protein [Sulfolobus polyhedral virus 1]|uniref:Uncharacterized protein n=1 Tax=Sulfolobus polyhedral virus 1 TaxID=1982658 RepID=A0A1W6I154_SPV1|nr:hypothetical protein DT302_gp12 [Sulfolobus polyhedral virus 1]ARM37794.1 hypothetical protein [Sulfolobus polyhedral virus 1]
MQEGDLGFLLGVLTLAIFLITIETYFQNGYAFLAFLFILLFIILLDMAFFREVHRKR